MLAPDAARRQSDDVVTVKLRRYETRDEVEADIGAAILAIRELAAIEGDWDEITMPVRSELSGIERALKATHGGDGERVARLDLSDVAKARRAPLFRRADTLRQENRDDLREWGKARDALRTAKRDLKLIETIRRTWKEPARKPERTTAELQESLF